MGEEIQMRKVGQQLFRIGPPRRECRGCSDAQSTDCWGTGVPIATELQPDDVLIVVWDGLVSGRHWEDHTRQRPADDPTWPSGRRRLADITSFDPSALTSAAIAVVVELLRSRISRLVGTKIAVAASDGRALARDFERRIDRFGCTTIVFNEVKSAADWLGIDLDDARTTITRLRAEAAG